MGVRGPEPGGRRGKKEILVRLDRKGCRANGDSRDQWVRRVCRGIREIRVKRGGREIREIREIRGIKETQGQRGPFII